MDLLGAFGAPRGTLLDKLIPSPSASPAAASPTRRLRLRSTAFDELDETSSSPSRAVGGFDPLGPPQALQAPSQAPDELLALLEDRERRILELEARLAAASSPAAPAVPPGTAATARLLCERLAGDFGAARALVVLADGSVFHPTPARLDLAARSFLAQAARGGELLVSTSPAAKSRSFSAEADGALIGDAAGGFVVIPLLRSAVDGQAGSFGAAVVLTKQRGKFGSEDEALARTLQARLSISAWTLAERQAAPGLSELVNALGWLLSADVANMFLADRRRQELVMMDLKKQSTWSAVFHGDGDGAESLKAIRIPMGSGLAGAAASQGNTINIKDAYQDKRFNREVDRKTGYRTTSVLCMPVVDDEQQPLAVIQCINKQAAPLFFADIDEQCARRFASVAAAVLASREGGAKQDVLNDATTGLFSSTQSTSVEALLATIMERARSLLQADNCTVFVLDHSRGELWTQNARDAGRESEIRISKETGIAGHVATTGEVVHLADAYESPLFNRDVDRKTGYRTRSVLCAPVRDGSGQVIGVVQAINKLGDSRGFGGDDIKLLAAFCKQAGAAMENALHMQRFKRLMEAAASISARLDLVPLLGQLMEKARELMEADVANVLLVDGDELWSKTARDADEIRIPRSSGIAGLVVRDREPLLIEDAYQHTAFNQAVDDETGFRTRTMMCLPILASRDNDDTVLGVIQAINKSGGRLFVQADQEILAAFAAQAAVAIENCRHFDTLGTVLSSVSSVLVVIGRDGKVRSVNMPHWEETGDEGAEKLDMLRNMVGMHYSDVLQDSNDGSELSSDIAEVLDGTAEMRTARDLDLFAQSVNYKVSPLGPSKDGVLLALDNVTDLARMEDALSRYLSPAVAKVVINDGMSLDRGVEQPMTVLFCDIRSYTSLAESLEPTEVVEMLNEFFEHMTDPIEINDGIVDKYIGDAIMAVFGVPFPSVEDDAEAACVAALEMAEALDDLNGMRAGRADLPIRIGLGISTGIGVAGNLGSTSRHDFSVIGDVVNLASRLEGLTKAYNVTMLVSDATVAQAKSVVFREIDTVRVVGKSEPVTVYEPVAESAEELDDGKKEIMDKYKTALEAYRRREFAKARALFEAIADDDGPAEVMAKRCARYETEAPDVEWGGVFDSKTK